MGKFGSDQHPPNAEDNYRATDGFKNMQMKKLAQKKQSELLNGLVNRPATQENNVLSGGKRQSSFQPATRK